MEGVLPRGKLNPKLIRYTIGLPAEDTEFLLEQAAIRGLTRSELITKVIRICIKDNLFKAILNDKKDLPSCQTKP